LQSATARQTLNYVGDAFNDNIDSVLLGKAAPGTGTQGCLWQNINTVGPMQKFVNASTAVSSGYNLAGTALGSNASSVRTYWGGALSPTC
jgi:hypothetical protein